jgi:hypothetical protein
MDRNKEEIEKLQALVFGIRQKANEFLTVGASEEHWKCLQEIARLEGQIHKLSKGESNGSREN